MSKRVRHRVKEIIILFIIILAGMTFSQVANAKPPMSKASKSMYRTSKISKSDKACFLLYKKRMNKQNMVVAKRSRMKVRPMAETDSPSVSAN